MTQLEISRGALTALGVAVVLVASCSGSQTGSANGGVAHEETPKPHWGYGADDGPEAWGSMDAEWSLCSTGARQSPVDLSGGEDAELAALAFSIPDAEGLFGAFDSGHTIQANTRNGGRLSVGGKYFSLAQFHFHAPSEHTLDGSSFPMEMHLEHRAADGQLAVFGVLIEEGAESSELAPLWSSLPELGNTETDVRIAPEFIGNLFAEAGGVYHYRGSLTTPPCSEGVRWYVRKSPIQLSAEQIAAFTARYDHNNRPIQPLNKRKLFVADDVEIGVR